MTIEPSTMICSPSFLERTRIAHLLCKHWYGLTGTLYPFGGHAVKVVYA